jgi:hypothetical protein
MEDDVEELRGHEPDNEEADHAEKLLKTAIPPHRQQGR